MAYVYDAKLIANQFLEFGKQENNPVDPMKIQKLVYLAHGWNLALYGVPLVSQPIEAWRYGPVISDLYQEFRDFRANPINRFANVWGCLQEPTKAFLKSVWDTYKNYTPIQLSMLTHEPGGAWDWTIRNVNTVWGNPTIPSDIIAQEFTRRKQQA